MTDRQDVLGTALLADRVVAERAAVGVARLGAPHPQAVGTDEVTAVVGLTAIGAGRRAGENERRVVGRLISGLRRAVVETEVDVLGFADRGRSVPVPVLALAVPAACRGVARAGRPAAVGPRGIDERERPGIGLANGDQLGDATVGDAGHACRRAGHREFDRDHNGQ